MYHALLTLFASFIGVFVIRIGGRLVSNERSEATINVMASECAQESVVDMAKLIAFLSLSSFFARD